MCKIRWSILDINWHQLFNLLLRNVNWPRILLAADAISARACLFKWAMLEAWVDGFRSGAFPLLDRRLELEVLLLLLLLLPLLLLSDCER